MTLLWNVSKMEWMRRRKCQGEDPTNDDFSWLIQIVLDAFQMATCFVHVLTHKRREHQLKNQQQEEPSEWKHVPIHVTAAQLPSAFIITLQLPLSLQQVRHRTNWVLHLSGIAQLPWLSGTSQLPQKCSENLLVYISLGVMVFFLQGSKKPLLF